MMKLEHHTQNLLSFPDFLIRLLRYLLFSLVLIAFSLAIGMLGYRYLANLSWLDSFHMSSMILTGMGPVAEMVTDQAKVFSSLYALYSGIAFLSITAIFFAPVMHRLLHILHVDGENSTH